MPPIAIGSSPRRCSRPTIVMIIMAMLTITTSASG
jgi:hypothetical protein